MTRTLLLALLLAAAALAGCSSDDPPAPAADDAADSGADDPADDGGSTVPDVNADEPPPAAPAPPATPSPPATPPPAAPAPPSTPPPPPQVTLHVATTGTLPLDPGFDVNLSAPAGAAVTLTFTNADQNPLASHSWVLEGYEDTAATPAISPGVSETATFTAPTTPGVYAFYCNVGGHRALGMEGSFTVT